jgi:hypothetical protein
MTPERRLTRRQECELGRIRHRYGRTAIAHLPRGLVLLRVYGDHDLGDSSALLMAPDGRILRGRIRRTGELGG